MIIDNDRRLSLMFERVQPYKTGDKTLDHNYIVGLYEDDLESVVVDCRYVRFGHLAKILDIPYREFYKLVTHHKLEGRRVYGVLYVDCHFMETFLFEHDEYSEEQYFAFLDAIDNAEERVYDYYITDHEHGYFIDSDILSQKDHSLL